MACWDLKIVLWAISFKSSIDVLDIYLLGSGFVNNRVHNIIDIHFMMQSGNDVSPI